MSSTAAQVRNELRNLNPKKVAGLVGISSRLLKSCRDKLHRVLECVINLSLMLRVVPQLWRTRATHSNPLTSHQMKTLEKLVLGHLCSLVSPSMDPLQFASQPNRRVQEAVIFLLHPSLSFTCRSSAALLQSCFLIGRPSPACDSPSRARAGSNSWGGCGPSEWRTHSWGPSATPWCRQTSSLVWSVCPALSCPILWNILLCTDPLLQQCIVWDNKGIITSSLRGPDVLGHSITFITYECLGVVLNKWVPCRKHTVINFLNFHTHCRKCVSYPTPLMLSLPVSNTLNNQHLFCVTSSLPSNKTNTRNFWTFQPLFPTKWLIKSSRPFLPCLSRWTIYFYLRFYLFFCICSGWLCRQRVTTRWRWQPITSSYRAHCRAGASLRLLIVLILGQA